jgi:hypothetical protein
MRLGARFTDPAMLGGGGLAIDHLLPP